MPEWAQPAFAGMTQLNRVQSKVYDTALFKPDNILLCAPTGAGKTNVAMLTILHQIGLHMKCGEFDNTKYKIVYVAPMKALVAEVVGNLSARLKKYNVTVRELSGDQNLTK
jgi:pre-mRNA-splicing helicase BRR2